MAIDVRTPPNWAQSLTFGFRVIAACYKNFYVGTAESRVYNFLVHLVKHEFPVSIAL
jgi:hypothetical protein